MKQGFIKLCLLLTMLCLFIGALSIGTMATEATESGVEFLYQQLTLADDLIMNFEIAIEESIAQKAVVKVTLDEAVTSYTVSQQTPNEKGNYSFSVDVAAAQMTEEINVAVTVDEGIVAERSYTVRAYAETVLNGNYGEEAEALVKEMLNYGAKAQSYFSYNVDNLAIAGYEADITPVAFPSETPELSVEGSVPGISYYGSSMLFTGKLAIRYYFTALNDVEGYTFTANGNSYKATAKDGLYYVDVAGINPQDIDKSVVLTVSDGSSSLSVGYGPMNYITRMWGGKGSDSLKSLLQALYGYHLAAKAYQTQITNSLSVCEAIKLLGTDTPAYINGYVAGYSVDGTRKAIILQDTVTGECIEFWGSDSGAYNDIWKTYEVGDHVTIYTKAIVDNKGLPRANKTVIPIMINGSYKLSSGNKIQVTEIADMDAFLNSVYSDGANTLGVYTCTVKVAHSNYFHEIITSGGKLRIQLYQSATTPTLDVGKAYTMKFVLTGYSKALSNTGNLYVRASVMDAEDVAAAMADYTASIAGETQLILGTAKPDFTSYFKIVDSVDGEITITGDMLTDNVDMNTTGIYEVKLSCLNSEGKQISETIEISVVNSLSVSEAVELMGKDTPAYINGYVAGYCVDNSTRKAIVLQDTVTGECIEFWGTDSAEYNDIWSTYAVGDHVTIHTESIVDNKGLPRADNTVTPIRINGSYKLSTGNKIRVTEIADMDAFLNSVYSDGSNTLGAYSCAVTVANSNYFHEITTSSGKLRIQLYDSVVTPTLKVGGQYTLQFVLTAYNKAMSNTGNLYVRVSVMDEKDVTLIMSDYTASVAGETQLIVGTAKPDFTSYFKIVDAVDGEIAVTADMITDNVNMSKVGTYEVRLSCLNSEGRHINETVKISVVNSLSVSEAIELLGTETPAYINGYVAGYSFEDTRKAILLQDTITGACIEFWGNDSSAYNAIWDTYEVGDHVTIHTESIVDNKGLPRADKTVTPIQINGSYKLSTGNEIQATEITDLDAFLNSACSGANVLGVYTCTVTVVNSSYLHELALTDRNIRIQLKQSVINPTLEVGEAYTMKFVLTGYSKALTNTGNLYVRISVMNAEDVALASQANIQVRAMSFNMKYEDQSGTTETVHTWANRKRGIAECIKNYLPDVIGTQELQCWQYEELMSLLGGSWKGVGLPRNGTNSERCAIIYNSNTVEYISGETIWLSETPYVEGSKSWDSAQPRILTYGKFLHKASQTEFYVFNTHLDHKSAEARANQLAIIVSYMDKYAADYPVILTGDFNMYITDEGFSAITDKADLYDHTFTPFLDELGSEMKTSHGYNGTTSGLPIDFIFYSKENIRVKSTQILHDMYQDTYYLSDHYPVYSVLVLNYI